MWCAEVDLFVCLFFFKQKTAYEMRISDWSSDVCSSDLRALHRLDFPGREIGCRSQRFTLDLNQLHLEPPMPIGVNMSIERQLSRPPWKNRPERRSASRPACLAKSIANRRMMRREKWIDQIISFTDLARGRGIPERKGSE